MRGRVGGRIGVAITPTDSEASGFWRLSDVLASKIGAYGLSQYTGLPAWPALSVVVACDAAADATATGSATFSATVTTNVADLPFSYVWQRSTNAGATWSVVSGSSGSSTAADTGYGGGTATVTLELTGQTIANDEDRYRVVVTAGIRTVIGQGSLRFDTVTLNNSFSGLTDGDYTVLSLTIASGEDFSYRFGWGGWGSLVGTKYGGFYQHTGFAMQSSVDGGATWQAVSGTNANSDGSSITKWYESSSSADNGKKWRGVYTFAGQDYYTQVATLTVT